MALSQSQRSLVEKARVLGSGSAGLVLSDEVCTYLVAVIVSDLGLGAKFPEIPSHVPGFFSTADIERLLLSGARFEPLLERLLSLDRNADTYFACLANLHKRRLKYQRILRSQPIPTIDQVGPRGLLQFGSLTPRALGALLFWRKWLYDIDNRAAQETGYLFEPIIAYAIGGASVSARQSPIKREGDGSKGRQVDCIRERRAYEFKLRVTIAASGQGRWGEELQFPRECQLSGFVPVLVVLDPTPNPKLAELTKVFLEEGGEVYTGAMAWEHLDQLAGPTMARFLETYIRGPIEALLAEASDVLPELSLAMRDGTIVVSVGTEKLVIQRQPGGLAEDGDEVPDDAGDVLPGV
jgi:hypothetical protein